MVYFLKRSMGGGGGLQSKRKRRSGREVQMLRWGSHNNKPIISDKKHLGILVSREQNVRHKKAVW